MKKLYLFLIGFINICSLFAFEMVKIPQIEFSRNLNDSNFQKIKLDTFLMSKDDIKLEDWSIFLEESKKSNTSWSLKYFKSDYSILDQIELMKFKDSSYGTIDMSSVNISMDSAIRWISWIDAIKYCNYLSEKEGYIPCYKISKNEYGTEKVIWQENANGYRLPTLAEWQGVAELFSKNLEMEYLCQTNNYSTYMNKGTDKLKQNSYGVINILNCIGKYLWDYYNVEDVDNSQELINPTGSTTFSPSSEALYYNDPIYEVRLCSNPFFGDKDVKYFIRNQTIGKEIFYSENFTIRICRNIE